MLSGTSSLAAQKAMKVDASPTTAARTRRSEAPESLEFVATSVQSPPSIVVGETRHCATTPSASEPATSHQGTRHRPPLSVVVISGSPDPRWTEVGSIASPDTPNLDAQFERERAYAAAAGDQATGTQQGVVSSVTGTNATRRPIQGGTSFKLKPRNVIPSMNGLSPPKSGYPDGVVGRKRRAHSLSSTQTYTTKSSGGTPPRFGSKALNSTDARKDVTESSVPSYLAEGSLCTLENETLSPPLVARAEPISLQALTLNSPISHQPPSSDSINSGSQHYAQQRADSSFTVYSESSARSMYIAGNSSTSDSAMKFKTPTSSTRSSPRQVPLTVISNSKGGSSIANMIPRPLHLGVSSLLHPLGRRKDGVSNSSNSTAGSSLSSDEGVAKTERDNCLNLPTSKKRFSSLSPRTPLPKISLTPRTPHSGSAKSAMPVFPSPLGSGSDEDGFDSSFVRPTRSPFTAKRDSIGETMDSLLHGFTESSCDSTLPSQDRLAQKPAALKVPVCRHESSNSLAFSADGSKDDKNSPAHLQKLYSGDLSAVESPDAKQLPKFRMRADLSKPSSVLSSDGLWENGRKNSLTSTEGETKASSSSLLSPCGPDDSQQVMFESARGFRHNVTDMNSLSDSDDEFVLADPIAISEEKSAEQKPHSPDHVNGRRVKQRIAIGLNPSHFGTRPPHKATALSLGKREVLTSSSIDSASPQPLSSTSFSPAQDPSCASASNASLFGMDIVQEEACSMASSLPSVGKLKGSGSLGALRRRGSEGAFGSTGSLSRRRSEHSLGSLGLPLDDLVAPNEDAGRDLVTPPVIMRSRDLSPPPLAPQHKN